jgi:hypothetical protein
MFTVGRCRSLGYISEWRSFEFVVEAEIVVAESRERSEVENPGGFNSWEYKDENGASL